MEKLNRNNLSELWRMKDLSVQELYQKIAVHPELRFLITTVGIGWVLRFLLNIFVFGNLIYFGCRLVRLVLG